MTSNFGYDAPPAPPRAQYRQAQPPRAHDSEAWPVIRQSAARLSRYQEAFAQQLHYDVDRKSVV